MLPCSLPYIRNIRKTIHTTIWPNNNNSSNNNNNNNNNSESNYNASFPKKSESEAVSESTVYKVIIEKKGSLSGQTSEPSEEVKVEPARLVFGTPHPLRRVRPDSPHVEGKVFSRSGEGWLEGRCERISEREEEESMSDSETEDNDGDYNDDEEEEDSVFEEVGESEEQKEKNCPMTGMR